MKRRRRQLGAMAVAACACVLAMPALAGAAEPTGGEVSVAPGGSFTVKGTGCVVNDEPGNVSIGLAPADDPEQVDEIPSDGTVVGSGNWTIKAMVPKTFAPGTYDVVVMCEDSEDSGEHIAVTGDITIVHVTGGAVTPTTTATSEGPGTEPTPKPKIVKATPLFTG